MGDFLVLTDLNYVTIAFNRRHILTVTLTDAGVYNGRPLVSITMVGGGVFRMLQIPGPGGSSSPYGDTQRAVELFFDDLAGVDRG